MQLLAIDPGPELSAFVLLDGTQPAEFGIMANHMIAAKFLSHRWENVPLAIEMVASYGMPVGKDVFETCVWIGQFIQLHLRTCTEITQRVRIYRKDVKMNLCHSMKAKDSNIRQALIDRYGPGKDKAIGKKATPGPLYGFKSDLWAALAVGVTALDTEKIQGDQA